MNMDLIDPSTQEFPEAIEEGLEDGLAVCGAFNRRGSLLAVGCNDGRVVLWDFDTRGVARTLTGHVQTITSVGWSRNGRRLLSSSTDWHVIVWDVANSERLHTFTFDCPVMRAAIHPRNDTLILACPLTGHAKLIDTTKPLDQCMRPVVVGSGGSGSAETEAAADTADPSKAKGDIKGVVAVFDRRGQHIYVGTAYSQVFILDAATLEEKASILLTNSATGAVVKSICFSRDGEAFMVNASDRMIRVFRTEGQIQEHRFQDLVDRVQWKTCSFSNGGDFVVAGSAQDGKHHIHIWDREKGSLLKILDGPREGLLDLMWHPARPIIASISTYGVVYIWGVNYTENWSAFAPDFKELEENVEYIEREDEFDDVEDQQAAENKEKEEDVDVDIITVDNTRFASSDEEPCDDELIYLPVSFNFEGDAPAAKDGAGKAASASVSKEDGGGGKGKAAATPKSNTSNKRKKRPSAARKKARLSTGSRGAGEAAPVVVAAGAAATPAVGATEAASSAAAAESTLSTPAAAASAPAR